MKSFIIACVLALIALQCVLATDEVLSMYKSTDCTGTSVVDVTIGTGILGCSALSCAAAGPFSSKGACATAGMPTTAPEGTIMFSYYGPTDTFCSASSPKLAASIAVAGLDTSACVQFPTLPAPLNGISLFNFTSIQVNGCGNIKTFTDASCSQGENKWPLPDGLCLDSFKVQCKISSAPVLGASLFSTPVVHISLPESSANGYSVSFIFMIALSCFLGIALF